MKKIILFFLSTMLFIFLVSSCKPVSKCAAYGETHKFQNLYKMPKSHSKGNCPAYGETKKFQKGNKSYRKFNKYNYSCPAYGEHKKFQKNKKYYNKNRRYTYNSPSGRLNQGTIREKLLY